MVYRGLVHVWCGGGQSHIAEELATADRTLSGSRFGQAVLAHCKIPHFKQQRKSWLDAHGVCCVQRAVHTVP